MSTPTRAWLTPSMPGSPISPSPISTCCCAPRPTLGKLRATSRPEPADAFVIAVPTPFHADRSPNLDYIDAAADAIAPSLASGNVVILESTSPVGAPAARDAGRSRRSCTQNPVALKAP